MKDKVMATRQRATAVYLIDRLALRAGNEKDTSEEADTAGCCTLRIEHVTLEPPNWVTFDFLGKDSIRYHNKVQVADQVFKNLRLFMKGKENDDPLFDRLSVCSRDANLNN
jgi:DNA topoisomerase-1